ncbi:MAG: hypothetical protein WBA55_07525, partial [Allopontixanthobacter sediminis]
KYLNEIPEQRALNSDADSQARQKTAFGRSNRSMTEALTPGHWPWTPQWKSHRRRHIRGEH